MALLWRKCLHKKIYEVRQAGASVRLYTNGVFHSQYNHRRPITANLWNMLAVPAYFHQQAQSMRRIAVLGVGGGAVVRHLLEVAPMAEIVGVDLDHVHIDIARRYFGISGTRIKLIHADAVQWLQEYRGQKFDLIIDDLFGETTDEQQLPKRAVPITRSWLESLQGQLAPGGVLGFNLESPVQGENLLHCVRPPNSPFAQMVSISSPRYENSVVALLPKKLSRALSVEPAYQRMLLRHQLPYQFHLRSC